MCARAKRVYIYACEMCAASDVDSISDGLDTVHHLQQSSAINCMQYVWQLLSQYMFLLQCSAFHCYRISTVLCFHVLSHGTYSTCYTFLSCELHDRTTYCNTETEEKHCDNGK